MCESLGDGAEQRRTTMISKRLAQLLVEQVGSEFGAHQKYLGIAIYFERQSLSRFGKLFRAQSVEEAQHGQKIIDFLVDHDVEFALPAVKASPTTYASALEAMQVTLTSEEAVTAAFEKMAAAAIIEKDHTAFQFLQWFIEEQVEEERKARALIDLVASGINLFQAEAMLDRFE
jgi:ferritin